MASFVKQIVIGAATTIIIATSSAQSAEPAQRPPNIIVILADDLGCGDVSLYDGWVNTPRIDRMAKEGMTFTDFHSNSSVCSPTRTAFLTGRYQQRVGIVDVIVGKNEPDTGIPPATPTLSRVFQKSGYATALFGKWHCGYEPKLGTAMRREHWKMIIKGDDLQLYNLKNDLKETNNVAAQNPEIVDPMRRAIEKFKQTVTHIEVLRP